MPEAALKYNTFRLTDDYLNRIKRRQKLIDFTVQAESSGNGVDLSQYCGPVINQLAEGSCTACTVRDYIWWLQNKYGYPQPVDPSVNGLYYWGRLITGDLTQDRGSTFEAVATGAMVWGVVPSSVDPLSENTLYVQPQWSDVVMQASSCTVISPTTASLRAMLDSGKPVGIAIQVTSALYQPTVYNGLYVVDGGTVEQGVGHEIIVVGYQPDPTYGYLYKFQNSWGTGYGNGGFAYFSEAFLQKYMLDAATMDIPQKPTQPVQPNLSLQIRATDENGNVKSTFSVNENIGIGVILTNNGQTLLNQYVDITINGQSPSSIPISFDGWNGFPWSASNPGTYTFTATWAHLTASTTITVEQAQPQPAPAPTPTPTPTPKPTPSPQPKPAPNPTPQPSNKVLYQAVDCATRLTEATAKSIYDAGYKAVMRYLGNWAKSITADEVATIRASGLKLGLIWESDPTYVGYFTTSQAANDAIAAMASAQAIGAPKGTAIAFTVDYDAAVADMDAIIAYFGVLLSKVTDYKVGAYGDVIVIDALANTYGNKLWYWQTSAWSYGQTNAHNDMYQHTYDVVVGGVQVDVSDVYADPGFWAPSATPAPSPSPSPSPNNGGDTVTILQLGSTGPAVKQLQEDLNKILGLHLAVDGIFGPATQAAVKSFQLQHGLTVDGIYGPQTAQAMYEALLALANKGSTVTVDKGKVQALINALESALNAAKALL
ncbi:glycoside hydrolase domain-containing protein [Alicyclobacillus sendaiensis]|uniref:glycoside hydrolase domain-containing protein n=1 Tax=Alicyclobacillus sendaiensis TaxID=192387 RepID=UPI000782B50D|nr:glycoside hydrolase domain-containing protein [Alicyclobacillus sendaiensis]